MHDMAQVVEELYIRVIYSSSRGEALNQSEASNYLFGKVAMSWSSLIHSCLVLRRPSLDIELKLTSHLYISLFFFIITKDQILVMVRNDKLDFRLLLGSVVFDGRLFQLGWRVHGLHQQPLLLRRSVKTIMSQVSRGWGKRQGKNTYRK